jgi:hypothetical protein
MPAGREAAHGVRRLGRDGGPEQVYDDCSDYGRLARAIAELGVNPPLLACPVPPDDMGKNRADVDEVQDVRVFPVAG